MMYTASWKKYTLTFKRPGTTSRGTLHKKDCWFLWIMDSEKKKFGIGECGLLRGLSFDDIPQYEEKLDEVCLHINEYIKHFHESLSTWPSIRFAVEMAYKDICEGSQQRYVKNAFSEGKKGIPINGLVWMGQIDDMTRQVNTKIKEGYRCIKIKIGALDFETERSLLQTIRNAFSKEKIEIRVDANGAFSMSDVYPVLDELAKLDIHSIEQPIKANQKENMHSLCRHSPVPIALDEELITTFENEKKEDLLDSIQPQYIVLKPSLLGGWKTSEEWIHAAERRNIGWWITSALESNVGLNAIAQWTSSLHSNTYQGLGTGQLYTNNIEGPLYIQDTKLWHDPRKKWVLDSTKQT